MFQFIRDFFLRRKVARIRVVTKKRYHEAVNPVSHIHRLPEHMHPTHVCKEDDDAYWQLLPGRSSGSSGESKFECRECGKQMFRGGMGSSLWLERVGSDPSSFQ